MKFFIIFLSFLVANTALLAQTWAPQVSGVFDNFRRVHFIDENTGWAVAGVGVVYTTTNGGEDWISRSCGTSNTLYDVHFVDENTGWVVGEGGTIRKTTNGGLNWGSQTSGTSWQLFGVHFFDENTGIVVGENGRVIRTTNGGLNWVTQTSGTSISLHSVYFHNTTTGWAVGSSGTVIRTSNGGTGWSTQYSGTTMALMCLHFVDENTGWAVGQTGTIIKTTNGGTDWSAQTSGITQYINGVHFVDENTGWAVNWNGGILTTTDGGANWTSESSGTTNTLRDIFFIDANTGWAVGSGIILKYTGATLDAPSLVSPENNDENVPINITFEWDEVENATTYTLQVSTDEDFDALVVDEEGIEDTEFEVLGLDNGIEFFWRVKALNDNIESDWSDVWSFSSECYSENVAKMNINVLLFGNWDGNENEHIVVPVLIELRTGETLMESLLYRRLANVVDIDGLVTVEFDEFDDGDYWIIVRAASYLPIASYGRISINTCQVLNYDFSSSSDAVSNPLMTILQNGKYLMRPGDLNSDRRVNTVDLNSYLMPQIGTDLRFSVPAP